MAATAPARNAAGTKSCPSRLSRKATKTSPGCKLRVSIERPRIRQAGLRPAVPSGAIPGSPQFRNASTIGRRLGQGGPHRLGVRKRKPTRADDLAGLVTFTGNQQHIPLADEAHPGADRLLAVRDFAR